MKTMLFMLLVLPMFSVAQEKPMFLCQSPGQTFEIKKSQRTKKFIGTLFSSSQKPEVMDCVEKDAGYLCTKGDYIAKVQRGSTGRKIVQLELAGEFDVESGYIDTIYCR